MERHEHVPHKPGPPSNLGEQRGLVYCRACGWLLSSQANGPTAKMDESCRPARVKLR